MGKKKAPPQPELTPASIPAPLPAITLYPGVQAPGYTPTPDEYIDLLMPILSGAEFKVLMYVTRRTFGFGKNGDTISLNQMVEGITTRTGRVLDSGTGLTRSVVSAALQHLVAMGVIIKEARHVTLTHLQKNGQPAMVHKPSHYRLNIVAATQEEDAAAEPPHEKKQQGGSLKNRPPRSPKNRPEGSLKNRPPRSPKNRPGVVYFLDPQETVLQETVLQETVVADATANPVLVPRTGFDDNDSDGALDQGFPEEGITDALQDARKIRAHHLAAILRTSPYSALLGIVTIYEEYEHYLPGFSLLQEARLCRAWYDDPQRREKKKTPTPARFQNWLDRTIQQKQHHAASSPPAAAEAVVPVEDTALMGLTERQALELQARIHRIYTLYNMVGDTSCGSLPDERYTVGIAQPDGTWLDFFTVQQWETWAADHIPGPATSSSYSHETTDEKGEQPASLLGTGRKE